MKPIIIVFVTVAFGFVSCSVKNYSRTDSVRNYNSKEEQNVKLVDNLKYPPIEGFHNGFATGIETNAATEAVCAKGPEIIPTLISALDHSSWKQTVWIVFCLREMRVVEAKPRILELQREQDHGRFSKEPHDLTLDLEIQLYLDGR